MAIGTTAAILGSAVISGGAALAGASASKKAANRATASAEQTAAQNNALQREIYQQNAAVLSPFQQRGNMAGDAINALLGLGVPRQQQPAFNPQMNPMMRFYGERNSIMGAPTMMGYETMGGDQFMQGWQEQPVSQMASNPQADYNQAFNNYRNSTGYQFRFNEGMRALDAAAPVLNSGKRLKDLQNYGQNIASGEFGNYLGYLANQQGVGLSGASAQAGVGQNYASNVQANNNSAGTAAANAALMRGQATQNMYGGLANAFGNALGSSFAIGRNNGINNSITSMFQQNPGIF